MLEFFRIDISVGTGINKANVLKECDICHYLYFLDKDFKYEPYLCNSCHNLMQIDIDFNDVKHLIIIKETHKQY